MKNYFAPPPFAEMFKSMLEKEEISPEDLALNMRYCGRKVIFDVLHGTYMPTLKFLASSAVALNLDPHSARCYFRSAGYDMDAETPEYAAIREVIDGLHADDELDEKLDYLFTFGLAKKL